MVGAAYDEQNLFAKILRKEIPSYVIFETPASLAILDAFPCVEGHALLIPKCKAVGVEDLMSQSLEFNGQVMRDLAQLHKMVREATGASATNTLANSYPHSGQKVPHVHFHVVPRTENDNLLTHPKSSENLLGSEDAERILSKFLAQ